MKRNKILLTFVALTMGIGLLSGCKSSSENTESTKDTMASTQTESTQMPSTQMPSSEANTKVSFWNDKMLDAEMRTKISDVWTKASGLKLEINAFTDTSSYQTAMSQSIGDTKSAPNAFTWWSGEQLATLAKSGKLLPLDDLWDEIIQMGVSKDIKDALTVDGKAYAVPYSLLNNTCIYNKKAFEKAGIKDTPKTFDEFLDTCKKLKEAGITPIGLKNDSWASFIWFQALTASYDVDLYKGLCDGTIKYTDARTKKVFGIWKDMIDKGYFADPIAALDNAKRIATGECALYIEPQTDIVGFEKDYGLVPGEDIDTFVLPSMNGKKAVIFFEVAPMAVPAAVSDPDASKKLLKAYYTKDVQETMLQQSGIALTNTVKVDDPVISKIITMSSDSDKYQSVLRYYENTPSDLRDVALVEMAKFMAGKQSSDVTLSNIQKKADTVFVK